MLFVATVVKTHIVQFHIPYLKMLHDAGWETAVAAKNDYEDSKDCVIPYCDHYFSVSFGRSPFTRDNLRALASGWSASRTIPENGTPCVPPWGFRRMTLSCCPLRK